MSETLPPPPEWITSRLRNLIGLAHLNLVDPLHVDLARGVSELGQGAPDGQVLQRMRWHFVWHLRDAGARFAIAKHDYEHQIDRRTVELRATGEKPPSRAEAEQRARQEDGAARLNLAYLLAEQQERAMRKFLDAVDSAIELHRTDRADARKADAQHAQGMTGGA